MTIAVIVLSVLLIAAIAVIVAIAPPTSPSDR